MLRKLTIAAAIILAVAFAFYWQGKKIERLTAERDRYKGNTETLLSDIEQYRVRDSLSAARVLSLELSVKEYERSRSEDAQLIRELKGRNRDLSAVNKTQEKTIFDLLAAPKDTMIVRDSVLTPAVAVHCGDAWYDFDGLLTPDEFTGRLTTRDTLIVAESVRYRRFLWWKTKKVKDRRVDVVAKSPHTTIMGVEHVVIEK